MKNTQTAIIVLLLFLLSSSIGGIYYLNKEYEAAKEEGLKNIDVVVADKNISQMHQINERDIKVVKLPKSAVNYRVLRKEEVVGKFATTAIFASEPIVEYKISARLQAILDQNLTAQKDRLNIKFVLFQNPNYNLKKGDKIDIVGLYKNSTDKDDNNYEVTYTARSVKVLDFLKNGMSQDRPSIKNDAPKAAEDKKAAKAPPIIFADEMVLDMNEEEISRTLRILNKNHQLWMVLSNENRNDEMVTRIEQSLNIAKPMGVPTRAVQRTNRIREVIIKQKPIPQAVEVKKRAKAPTISYEDEDKK